MNGSNVHRASRMRTYVRASLAIAGRTLKTTFRNPALLMPPLVAPLIFFAVIGAGLGALGRAPGFDFPNGYTSFSFVFILLNAASFASAFAGLALAQDLESGFSRRLMLAASRRSELVVGYALTAIVRVALGVAVIFAMATAVGVRPHGSAWNVVWLVSIVFGFGLAVALWAIGMSFRTRSVQGAPATQIPVLMAMFFAPAFAPLALLGGWLHGAATWNPVSYLFESGRGFLANDPTDVGLTIASILGMLSLLTVWVATGLRRASRVG
jgi:ABC-2 type transport system permease protein